MKLAVNITRVKHVDDLRSPVISLSLLWSCRISTQRDLVGLDHLPLTQQLQRSLLLEHQYPVGMEWRKGLREHKAAKQPASKNPDTHAPDYSRHNRIKC